MANTGILSHDEYVTLGGDAGAMGGAGFRAGDSRGDRSQPARTGHGNCVCGSCGNGVARKAVPAGFPLHQPDQGNRRPTGHASFPDSTQTSHNQARRGGGALTLPQSCQNLNARLPGQQQCLSTAFLAAKVPQTSLLVASSSACQLLDISK